MITALAFLSLLAPFQDDAKPVTAELVTSVTAAQPAKPFLAAIILRMAPGWHVYWSNPGDSGTPTTVDWSLPAGWSASDLMWPIPSRFNEKDKVTYGYDGSTMVIARITPAADAKVGPITFGAKVSWLAYKDSGIAGSQSLSRSMSVSMRELQSSIWAKKLVPAEASMPRALDGWKFEAEVIDGGYVLKVTPPTKLEQSKFLPTFYCSEPGVSSAAVASRYMDREDGSFWIGIKRAKDQTKDPERLKGILMAPKGARWNDEVEAQIVDVPLKPKGS